MGECVNPAESRCLEQAAELSPHIRLGDLRGPPQLLANLVKAERRYSVFASQYDVAVVH
jgi:hypothetical protein